MSVRLSQAGLLLHHFPLHFSRFLSQTCPLPPPYPAKTFPHPSNPSCVPMKLSLIIPGRRELFFLAILRELTAFLDNCTGYICTLVLFLLEEFNSSLIPSLYIIISQWKFIEKIRSWDGLFLEASKLANYFLTVCLRCRPNIPTTLLFMVLRGK